MPPPSILLSSNHDINIIKLTAHVHVHHFHLPFWIWREVLGHFRKATSAVRSSVVAVEILSNCCRKILV